jgi:hypothetical protein
MAILDCHYQCGCGFSTTEPLKALDHCNITKHSLTVSGQITPGTPRPNQAHQPTRRTTQLASGRAPQQLPQPASKATIDASEFDRLRRLLSQKR